MRVKMWMTGPDARTVLVQRTRRDENPSRVAKGVSKASLQATVETLVKEVSPTQSQIPLALPGS